MYNTGGGVGGGKGLVYLQWVAVSATVTGLSGVEMRSHSGTSLAGVSKFVNMNSSLGINR